ncbi:MAG: hypothetical protein ACRCZF_06615 [Gemmataceae bacterium]
MISQQTQTIAESARRIYDEQLRAVLEAQEPGRYVAVEPVSGDHFVADSFDAASDSAQLAHPTRQSHILRVGHRAALHIGGVTK